jgi:hypothetical protein
LIASLRTPCSRARVRLCQGRRCMAPCSQAGTCSVGLGARVRRRRGPRCGIAVLRSLPAVQRRHHRPGLRARAITKAGKTEAAAREGKTFPAHADDPCPPLWVANRPGRFPRTWHCLTPARAIRSRRPWICCRPSRWPGGPSTNSRSCKTWWKPPCRWPRNTRAGSRAGRYDCNEWKRAGGQRV